MATTRTVALGFVSRFPWFWDFISSVPLLRTWVNRLFINFITNSTPARPHPLSLWGPAPAPGVCSDYTSWTGLVDRTYSGRHLPPADPTTVAQLPSTDRLVGLFLRQDELQPCGKSSALFGFFAQWFTDSFLRTDPNDVRKNTSNHEIDLCQIYGLTAADTALLRSRLGGELKMQEIGGQLYPPFLFKRDGSRVKDEYLSLSYINDKTGEYRNAVLMPPFDTPERKAGLFVTGLERGNSTIYYSAINIIFMREHNRLCREIAKRHPDWDDDRLFETARNVNIACLLKVIIEDYINHLTVTLFKVFVEIGFAERQNWYRTNHICAEFDLLYRWHPLIPTELNIGKDKLPSTEFRFNNQLLVKLGIEDVLSAATSQRAGRIGLENTAPFLVPADLAAIEKSRAWRLRSYNEYRVRFGLPPLTSFLELCGDGKIAEKLAAAYDNDINRVEFLVGLFAEQRAPNAVLGELMTLMVGVDAFSQALTNPLLSQNVYGPLAFSEPGLQAVNETSSFDSIVRRNSSMGNRRTNFSAGLTPPGSYGLPILGTIIDTVDFFLVSGWRKFFERRRRKYGSSVFKVNLFRPTIAMMDGKAISALFKSKDLIQDYGFSWAVPPLDLVGNVPPSIFESGLAHDRPKSLYMRLLQANTRALGSTFGGIFATFTEKWLSAPRFSWRDELENFSATFLFTWFLGASPDPVKVRALYNGIFLHFAVPIARLVPWSSFSKSLVIYKDLLEFIKGAPKFSDILVAAKEQGLTDANVVAKQIAFMIGMNSFLGMQNFLKSIVGELSNRPDLREVLRAEIVAGLGAASAEPDIAKVSQMPLLDKTLREILRLHPPVFFVFGRATRDRLIDSDSGSFVIRKGELAMGVIPFAHLDEFAFLRPEDFNPDRFDDPDVSAHLIWPRGRHDDTVVPEDRTCPGKDVAILVAKLFAVSLLRDFDWQMSTRKQRWEQRFFGLNVAAPVGPLEVKTFRRR